MVGAILKIIAELLGFVLPLAKKRIDEADARQPQNEVLDFQDAVGTADDEALNAMLHDWETRSPDAGRRQLDRALADRQRMSATERGEDDSRRPVA